jgi:hypothetical protein
MQSKNKGKEGAHCAEEIAKPELAVTLQLIMCPFTRNSMKGGSVHYSKKNRVPWRPWPRIQTAT